MKIRSYLPFILIIFLLGACSSLKQTTSSEELHEVKSRPIALEQKEQVEESKIMEIANIEIDEVEIVEVQPVGGEEQDEQKQEQGEEQNVKKDESDKDEPQKSRGQDEIDGKNTGKEPNVTSKNVLLPDENSKIRETPITHVLIHFTSNVLNKPDDPYQYEDIRKVFMDYGLSAHYLIGRNGEIYQLVPENRVAFHAGKGGLANFPEYKDKLNDYSIGIEMMAIGTKEEMSIMMSEDFYESIHPKDIGYTDAQYESLTLLLKDIWTRNPSVKKDRDHIIGHDEYAPDRKTDPGTLFDWSRIGF
ncbi:N-acetylmuramoyl-L-alanine amidase [Oceanobacillus salinisoli]|uniref:N-acetylmuramoyl-L-alanine amidase n=1 Tax=Oceanobacillus salinisoli TaxID=2678611 RepID=UPI001E447541|nr:N-acetylmuramoyl-L-alanine amidase [Oceanobacillus salinisoli]